MQSIGTVTARFYTAAEALIGCHAASGFLPDSAPDFGFVRSRACPSPLPFFPLNCPEALPGCKTYEGLWSYDTCVDIRLVYGF